jgi:hypothetical protein
LRSHFYDRTPETRRRILAWQAERVDLAALEQLPLTYREVGATADGRLPPGYGHLHLQTQIGTGQQRFEQAADAVMHWGMQRGAGLRVQASSEVVELDAVVLVGMMGFLRAPDLRASLTAWIPKMTTIQYKFTTRVCGGDLTARCSRGEGGRRSRASYIA